MKKIIYLLGALLIGYLIYLIANQKEDYFNKVKLSTSNSIYNRTKYKYLDTIVSVALDKVNMKGAFVIIKPLGEELKNSLIDSNRKLLAHVQYSNGYYIIWVDDTYSNRSEFITVFSHEVWHMKQYQTKRLVLTPEYPYWLGNKMDMNKLDYMSRPWEIEAFQKEKGIEQYVKQKLYKM